MIASLLCAGPFDNLDKCIVFVSAGNVIRSKTAAESTCLLMALVSHSPPPPYTPTFTSTLASREGYFTFNSAGTSASTPPDRFLQLNANGYVYGQTSVAYAAYVKFTPVASNGGAYTGGQTPFYRIEENGVTGTNCLQPDGTPYGNSQNLACDQASTAQIVRITERASDWSTPLYELGECAYAWAWH